MAANEGNGNGRVENDTAGWSEVDVGRVAAPEIGVPFRLWVNRVKSSSPDSELLIHEPLTSMVDKIDGVEADFQVTTLVVNHHRTLSKVHLFATALVAVEARIVVLVLYKYWPSPA